MKNQKKKTNELNKWCYQARTFFPFLKIEMHTNIKMETLSVLSSFSVLLNTHINLVSVSFIYIK